MPDFLQRQDIYNLLERENPEDVYPHSGDPSNFLSTAENDSVAKVVEDAYTNLQVIYRNIFLRPQMNR